MTWQIAFVLLLLVGAIVCFAREKIAPDVIALSLLVIVAVAGLVPLRDVLSVFSNPAPITVGAMFVLSAAQVRCGALDYMSVAMEKMSVLPYQLVLFVLVLVVAFVSAWINNTPVVVVFVPVVIGLARKMRLPASKFLIPLSYASVLGGVCVLIGTSTNLVVNGVLVKEGLPGLNMFELAWVGIPSTIVAAIYL